MADGGSWEWELALPELEERRKILNNARLVCDRAKLLAEALDEFSSVQTFQREWLNEFLAPGDLRDSIGERRLSA
jgi:hypothetical protein